MRRGVLRFPSFMGRLFVGGMSLFVSQISCSMAREVISDGLLAEMSQDAYHPRFGRGKEVFSLEGASGKESVAFFFQHRGQEVLAFRGSHSDADWLVNLDATLAPCPLLPVASGKIHQGFCHRAKQLSLRILGRVRGDSSPIYLTGHSQGGAVAALVALAIKFHWPQKEIHLVTFGAPSLGDQVFSTYLERGIPYRQRHYMILTDLVPAMPLMFGFLKEVVSKAFFEQEVSGEAEAEFSPNPCIVWLPLSPGEGGLKKGEMSDIIQHGINHYVYVLKRI